MLPETITPLRNSDFAAPHRPLLASMARGFTCRCPNCGKGRLFGRFLKPVATCSSCGEDFTHQRADDAPPYFTIVIVGHVVVSLLLAVEMAYRPPLWLHAALWLPLTVLLALVLLPPIKGALVGLQWALLMHGFDPNTEDEKIESFDASVSRDPAR
jgi:uncharacterized protein (DUF983 family)